MPYPRTIIPPFAAVDGPAVTTPASATDATPQPFAELPSNLLHVGGVVFVNVIGRFTSTGTPGTLIVDIRFATPGTAFGSAISIVTSTTLVPLASQTNKAWHAHYEIECVSLGLGGAGIGQVRGAGRILGLTAAGSVDLVPTTAPMTAVSINTTTSQRVMVVLTPSVTTGSVTIHNVVVEYSGD